MNRKQWMEAVREARREAESRVPRRGPGAGMMLMLVGLGAAVGAGAAYLLDPERGRARRARYADQAAALARDAKQTVERTTSRVASSVEGKAAALRHHGDGDVMPNDAALSDKVETELFSDPAVPKGGININSEQGVVVLRGEVPNDEMRRELEKKARAIPGVWEVENLLHLPGEAAPTSPPASPI